MPFDPMSPAGQRLVQAIAEACIRTGQPDLFGDGAEGRPLRVRPHLRERSALQRVVLSAVRTGLMRRDSRGRFIGLDPRLKQAIAAAKARLTRSKQLTRTQIRELQRATFALIPHHTDTF